MPDLQAISLSPAPAGAGSCKRPKKRLDQAVFDLAAHLARLPPGPLAELRRMTPGTGNGAFWRVYFLPELELADQRGTDVDWEWIVHALALLTPSGRDPGKRSAHDGRVPLGQALYMIGVSEARVAQVLEAGPGRRRDYLLRLVRMLAREQAVFNTADLAGLLLPDVADPASGADPLRRLARTYYAAEAAAKKENDDV